MDTVAVQIPATALAPLLLEAATAQVRGEFATAIADLQTELARTRAEVEELRAICGAGSRWLDTEAAAAYAGCKPRRIYELKSSGRLVPSGFDGRKPLYTASDLDRCFRRHAA